MSLIGQHSVLPIVRHAPPGYYLDGGALGEILLPGRYIPPDAAPGGSIKVFVYRDSEDRLVATTQSPHAIVGEFAYLRVVSVNPGLGAFLDWGLEKDLLLPIREHCRRLIPGEWVVVRVLLDEISARILASARTNRWVNLVPPDYAEGQSVKLLVEGETPLGFSAIVNHAHRGLLYATDLAGPLSIGQKLDGFVRQLRPDGKIDLGLDRVGYRRIGPLTEQVIEALQTAGGHLPLHDQSTPEEIRTTLGMSKKAFKQAIGALYRKHRIHLEPAGIRLAPKTARR